MGIDTFDFTPDPISLLESNRNLGYSIEEAISDLIDNSISANATKISYETHWNQGNPYFLLKDNGKGMSNLNNDLINSFRLGSRNPLDERDPNDLGRFGFGMKTASLSQARILTVITKKKGYNTLALSLDLNFIRDKERWLLKSADNDFLRTEFEYLDKLDSGTVIRWDNWDRAPKLEEDFMSLISNINNYLSVCFHRFIEKGVSICCHDYPLEPCSPIPFGEGSALYSKIPLAKNNKAKQISYILQHPKKWEEDYENINRFNSFHLFDGFERQQGIYIYRCDRLLTPRGGWLGLLRKGNAAKLARVVIDYPNDADALWSLDITKTNASIPFEFKREIKKLIDTTKKGSVRKIVRGNRNVNRSLSQSHSNIWKTSEDREFNSYKYIVDTEHPIFRGLIEENKIKEKDLKFLLKLISENLPVSKIIDNNDSDPSKHDRMLLQNKLSETDLEIAKILFQNQMKTETKAVAFSWLLNFEPYCYFEEQLKKELL
jgi:hypothetical protein